DRSPRHRDVRPKICAVQSAYHPIPSVAQPEYGDTASPNPKRNDLGTAPWQTRAPADLQKAAPQLVESLSVAPRRVCSFSSPRKKGATNCSRCGSRVQSPTAAAP